jgi:hypothetical protein
MFSLHTITHGRNTVNIFVETFLLGIHFNINHCFKAAEIAAVNLAPTAIGDEKYSVHGNMVLSCSMFFSKKVVQEGVVVKLKHYCYISPEVFISCICVTIHVPATYCKPLLLPCHVQFCMLITGLSIFTYIM